jgi:hypothetical protein
MLENLNKNITRLLKSARRVMSLFTLVLFTLSCQTEANETNTTQKPVEYALLMNNLSDEAYPDNPDIGYRSEVYDNDYLKSGNISVLDENLTISFFAKTTDTITFQNVQLNELMPTIPNHLKQDEYMSYVALINQEWNRNQVQFNAKEFNATNKDITRVDIARNCINAYLWEVSVYKMEAGKEVPYTHGWFNFPKELYKYLFEKRNGVDFSTYRKPLENWVDVPSKEVRSDLLAKKVKEIPIDFSEQNTAMYPLEGARLKKFKEIIYPAKFKNMQDLENDSTLFATFTPPGYYNKADPRITQLGRIKNLQSIVLNKVTCQANNHELDELRLTFKDADDKRTTKLIIGGLDFSLLPHLSVANVNKAWRISMGFSNHPFYESYEEHLKWKSKSNPYYGYLTNEKNEWLDSHTIGIDGPMMHWDDKIPNRLHVWVLSFERHAFVGHYIIDILPTNNTINS